MALKRVVYCFFSRVSHRPSDVTILQNERRAFAPLPHSHKIRLFQPADLSFLHRIEARPGSIPNIFTYTLVPAMLNVSVGYLH